MEERPDRKQIGKALQRARKNAGFKSAKAFAEHMGLSVGTYTDYEQGRTAFNYEQAWLMADELKCSMDELGGREWPRPGAADPMSPDELALVADFRRMDDGDRPGFVSTARALAYAGDAKKEDRDPAAHLAGRLLTSHAG